MFIKEKWKNIHLCPCPHIRSRRNLRSIIDGLFVCFVLFVCLFGFCQCCCFRSCFFLRLYFCVNQPKLPNLTIAQFLLGSQKTDRPTQSELSNVQRVEHSLFSQNTSTVCNLLSVILCRNQPVIRSNCACADPLVLSTKMFATCKQTRTFPRQRMRFLEGH